MKRTSEKEIQAVLRLDGEARLNHFIKRVVDAEAAWGLWKDGWALMESGDGVQVFPLWPTREYAELCRSESWVEYEARRISLTDLLDELVPKLTQDRMLPGVFPTREGKGVTPTPEALAESLRKEMENYK